jgi:hypothetical protein
VSSRIVTSLQRRRGGHRSKRKARGATLISRRISGFGWQVHDMTYEERVVREENPAPVYDAARPSSNGE